MTHRFVYGVLASLAVLLAATHQPGADTPATSPTQVRPCTEDELALVGADGTWGCVHIDAIRPATAGPAVMAHIEEQP